MCNKLPEGSTFIFGDGQISLQHSVGQVKGSRYTKKQLDSLRHLNRTPTVTDHGWYHTTTW